MRFAYADPPYIGQAKRHYSADPRCAEVDHVELITQLTTFDAWALSLSTPSCEEILHICRRVVGPNKVRLGSWVKPFASFKRGVNPGYCWEPLVFIGGRKRERTEPTVRDWHSANITLRKGLAGVKPESVCFWLFDLLGAVDGDEFSDLYPGSGGVTRAWEKWCNQLRLSA